MEWQIQEIFVHYNLAEVRRGREQYHVMDFQKPIFDFLDIDTTTDTPEKSLKKILKYVKKV